MCDTMLPPLATQPYSVVDPTIGQGSQLREAQIFIGSACKTPSTLILTPHHASPFYVLCPWSPPTYSSSNIAYHTSFFYHSASSDHSSLSSVTDIDAQKSHNHEFSVHYF
ncbi:hypothetical protein VNO80_21368 [Phaseolus coccineus]|uniref:Uncharacterized protein n=1 Tax=Phaseolus coccineus TaxID=3886 RepID=A0AAN9M2C7_PHACN